MAPPTDIAIIETPIDGGVRLSATAQPGDPAVESGDLLYFWKLGDRDAPYTGRDYAVGQSVEVTGSAMNEPVWLVVSDQRGGETWTAARPAP